MPSHTKATLSARPSKRPCERWETGFGPSRGVPPAPNLCGQRGKSMGHFGTRDYLFRLCEASGTPRHAHPLTGGSRAETIGRYERGPENPMKRLMLVGAAAALAALGCGDDIRIIRGVLPAGPDDDPPVIGNGDAGAVTDDPIFDPDKRAYLRAPIKTELLYEDEGAVLTGRCKNISEGGILIGDLSHVPEINVIPLLIDLPLYPDFARLNIFKIDFNSKMEIERKIVRLRCKIVRSFQGKSEVEQALLPFIGCQFVEPSPESILVIREYVSLFARNIVFLLTLFEQSGRNQKQLPLLRYLAKTLGYDDKMQLAFLRQKILHDYQSLESL